ncbi:MAG: DUF362 domain-containing protein [Syntrophorhabdales bacterium]
MNDEVYVVRCPDYHQAAEKLDLLLSRMGGPGRFVAPGEKIVLKVNLLQPSTPEQAICTHPAIVTAVGRMVKGAGAVATIADSPGAGYKYNEKALNTLYARSGMVEAAEEAGIAINLDTSYQPVSFPEGKLIKRFEVITPVIEADAVFNLCKLKTHVFMSMTGAVKNNFGVIPGLAKPGYHAKLHDTAHFADMLLDLAAYVSPRISIMDAVVGIEGEGPGATGTPRHVGLLLASVNPLALDVVAGEIIGLRREQNPVLLAAAKRGLAPTRLEEVSIIGADISELKITDYKFPVTIYGGTGMGKLPWWQKALAPIFKSGMSLTPRVVAKKCVGCAICRDSCPVGAITITEEKPKHARIDEKKCIRCYCCHELCPEKAVELRKGFFYRQIMRD